MLHSGIVKFQLQDFFSCWWCMSQKRAEAKWLQSWHSWKRFPGRNWTNQTRIYKYGSSHSLFLPARFSWFMCEIWIPKWNMNYRRLHWAPIPQHDMPGQSGGLNSMWFSCLPMCCALGDTYWGVIEVYLLNSAWILLYSSLISWNPIFHPDFWYPFSK